MPVATAIKSEIWLLNEPGARLFWPFLLTSLMVWALWLVLNEKTSIRRLAQLTLSGLKSPSFRTDLMLFGFNGVLKATLFSGFGVLATEITWFVAKNLPRLTTPIQMDLALQIGFTLFAFLFDDFLRFLMHFLLHHTRWGWSIHKVHHSATVLTPLTLYRAHPLEVLLATLRNAFSAGIVAGLGIVLFQWPNPILTVLGVGVFGWVFNSALANLRHSHCPIRFGPFEKVFISPYMHQIHHSSAPEHWDKNFGVSLSIWDRIFGSYYVPKKEKSQVISLKFGLIETQKPAN